MRRAYLIYRASNFDFSFITSYVLLDFSKYLYLLIPLSVNAHPTSKKDFGSYLPEFHLALEHSVIC